MTGIIQVQATAASEAEAERIASALIEHNLAACVQTSGPIRSRYRWQGKQEESTEWLCTIKTTAERYAQVERAIIEVHSYVEPEIIATEVVAGSKGYLRWVRDNVTQP